MLSSRVRTLFNIEYPIIQAGMVWASGWELASAVSNAGGLGLIGAGSMNPEKLRHHIKRCKEHTTKPFGVNLPLLHPATKEFVDIVLQEEVPIVFSSAGSPKTWTPTLKKAGVKVVHVVGSRAFAIKCEDAGCDAVVAEGFEAGGHNGVEETTTLVLVPSVADAVKIPVIAAGGIYDGRTMAAAFALGAEGVQVGSRFITTPEASCHPSFKERVLSAKEGDTKLSMKKVIPVRLLKNEFFEQVKALEDRGASREEFQQLLGKGRSKRGMFEGDLAEGELEIGQCCANFPKELTPAGDVVRSMVEEYRRAVDRCRS
jgi:enoyl-[acyl-carrier protein] reductase II|eukprot:gene8598-6190_t